MYQCVHCFMCCRIIDALSCRFILLYLRENLQLVMACIWWLIIVNTVLMASDAHQQLAGYLANQSAQKSLLIQDVFRCTRQTLPLSLTQFHRDRLWCLKNMVSHCLSKQPSMISTNMVFTMRENKSYCGSIWTKEKHAAIHFVKDILITVIDKHYLHFSFVYFNLSLSRYLLCSQHALVLTSGRHESFCGIRIPWKFILQQNHASFKLIIAKYRAYHFKLVYSSFTMSWLGQISLVTKSHYLTNQIKKISLDIFDVKIKSYEYYITTSPHNILSINQSIKNITSNVFMHIYDGPGPLSNIIFDLHKVNPLRSSLIRSSTFSAFVIIELITGSTYNMSFEISILSSKNPALWRYCPNELTEIHEGAKELFFRSHHWRNTYCEFVQMKYVQHMYIHVIGFTFSGPNMITDISPHTCQYGGLLIYINNRDKYFTICEDVYDLFLGGSSFLFEVVWLAGYSQGKVRIRGGKDKCRTLYAELSLWDISETREVEMTLQKSTGCTIFICPPANTDSQMKCIINLNNYPSLGRTQIRIGWTQEKYHSEFCDNKFEVTTQYFESVHWPFIVRDNVGYHRLKTQGPISMIYNYLYNATVSLSHMHCWTDPYFERLTVFVKISSCDYDYKAGATEYHYIPYVVPLNGCRKIFRFKAHQLVEFMYKDSGYANNTVEKIYMKYKNCPKDCRIFKYHVYALDIDGETVIQYIADVGTVTYTHDNHRGFRINPTPDGELPVPCMQSCRLVLEVKPLEREDLRQRRTPLYFTKPRYEELLCILTMITP